jgi:hypothetical protein
MLTVLLIVIGSGRRVGVADADYRVEALDEAVGE